MRLMGAEAGNNGWQGYRLFAIALPCCISIARDPASYGLIVDKEFPAPKKDRLVMFSFT
jgi:hypothetical protein